MRFNASDGRVACWQRSCVRPVPSTARAARRVTSRVRTSVTSPRRTAPPMAASRAASAPTEPTSTVRRSFRFGFQLDVFRLLLCHVISQQKLYIQLIYFFKHHCSCACRRRMFVGGRLPVHRGWCRLPAGHCHVQELPGMVGLASCDQTSAVKALK